MKILLIDDEVAITDIFQEAFKRGGFTVVVAHSGREGIEKAKQESPNVIFLDQILPDINGNQVLEILKDDIATKTIPVAILSNFNQDQFVEGAMKHGVSHYILKYQVSPQDLVEKANQIINESKGTGWKDTSSLT